MLLIAAEMNLSETGSLQSLMPHSVMGHDHTCPLIMPKEVHTD